MCVRPPRENPPNDRLHPTHDPGSSRSPDPRPSTIPSPARRLDYSWFGRRWPDGSREASLSSRAPRHHFCAIIARHTCDLYRGHACIALIACTRLFPSARPPRARSLRARRRLDGGKDHTARLPPGPLHEVVDDGVRTPVRVCDYRLFQSVTEGSARHAVDEDRRVARRKDKVVHVRCRAHRPLAQHVREAPTATPIAHRMPFGELESVGQPREQGLAAHALRHHHAHHRREAPAFAHEHVAGAHRTHLERWARREAVRWREEYGRVRTEAASAAHELIGQRREGLHRCAAAEDTAEAAAEGAARAWIGRLELGKDHLGLVRELLKHAVLALDVLAKPLQAHVTEVGAPLEPQHKGESRQVMLAPRGELVRLEREEHLVHDGLLEGAAVIGHEAHAGLQLVRHHGRLQLVQRHARDDREALELRLEHLGGRVLGSRCESGHVDSDAAGAHLVPPNLEADAQARGALRAHDDVAGLVVHQGANVDGDRGTAAPWDAVEAEHRRDGACRLEDQTRRVGDDGAAAGRQRQICGRACRGNEVDDKGADRARVGDVQEDVREGGEEGRVERVAKADRRHLWPEPHSLLDLSHPPVQKAGPVVPAFIGQPVGAHDEAHGKVCRMELHLVWQPMNRSVAAVGLSTVCEAVA
ncbi:hypothetical protein Ctob_006149, partial [Chrysochromulina tobinii]